MNLVRIADQKKSELQKERMRSSSTKQAADNNRGLNGRFFTLRSRLYNALGLGLRNDEGGRRWCCTDVETQRHVVRSIDAFLDCISSDMSQHPLVKESLADIVPALGTTLIEKNEAVMKLASKVFVKMVKVVHSSILESLVLDIVHPLSSSLSSNHIPVVISCATALNLIFMSSSLSSKREKQIWKVLEETQTINNIIHHIRSSGGKPAELFLETTSLLSKILYRYPSSRFCVWNDTALMQVVDFISHEPILSVKAAVLELYSTIALCSNGAKKLLAIGSPLQLMVECMDASNPGYLQLAGFTLAECFAVSEEGRYKMMESYCEPLVKAIINGMSFHSSGKKLTKDQMSLIKVSCCVSKIICWPGKHHNYFWKLGIESVLVKLLLDDFYIKKLPEELLADMARDGLSANFLPVIKPHVWDILGGLATHCAEDFHANMLTNELHLNILITCACLGFVDSLRSTRQSCRNAVNESVCRAVVLMIYSPSKYIASQTKSVLSGMLKPNYKEDIKYLLNTLNNNNASDNPLQVINLISLACYSGLPQYRRYVIKNQGMKMLLSFIQQLPKNHQTNNNNKNNNASLHYYCDHNLKMCCYGCEEEEEEDWEGEETLLLFGLLGLAELVHSVKGDVDWFEFELTKSQIISEVEKICINSHASGPKWYGAYLLSYFGFYGFPSKLGNMIGNVFLSGDDDYEQQHTKNLRLILGNHEEHVNVDGVIVRVRCPSLCTDDLVSRKEIRLSAHVSREALLKLLEYVYSGHLRWAGDEEEEVVNKRLKTLAKHCNLQPLLQMLCRNRPKWTTSVPSFDLTSALGPNACPFSDIVLEAKGNAYEGWMCETCSLSQPHLHAHKAILCASCEHMRALLNSGMQESHSEILKVDLGWEALVRLVKWFYCGKLRGKPNYGCLWNNLNEKEKLDQIIPYVELYCLSDRWLLQDLHKECSRVIESCLELDNSVVNNMAIKIIQIGADCFQSDLVELAAKFIAPSYHRLRNSRELLQLDEQLVDIVRAASVSVVRLTQQHHL